MIQQIHTSLFATISSLLERRPSVGWLFAAVSTGGGFIGIVETSTKIIGLAAAVVGLVVGLYTLVIQRRTLAKLNAELKK